VTIQKHFTLGRSETTIQSGTDRVRLLLDPSGLVVSTARGTTRLGAGEAAARPSTRKAWAAAFKIPGQSNVAAAGFKLPPISAAGTIPGARVKATFNVSQVVGTGLTLVLQVAKTGVAGSQEKASTPLMGPGSYTVTTDPFSLLEGGQYQAKAFVNAWAGSTEGDLCAAVLTITEIKWEF